MRPTDLNRLKEIHRILFAMAQGKFHTRIARTEEDDIIESIVVLVNMMAEEMKDTLKLYAELHQHTEDESHIYMVFILDHNFRILYVSSDVMLELGYETGDLLKESFSSLLSKSHLGLWRSIGSKILYAEDYNEQHRLILLDKDKTERYCSCIVTSLYAIGNATQYIMVSVYEPVIKSRMMEDAAPYNAASASEKLKVRKPPNVVTRPKDRRTLQRIHTYILENLEKPLPHLDVLAHNFGTNEFKLKYGFRQMYGNTVFRFLKRERMRKAKVLLENTSLPVKTIAEMCGYLNASHFSKDFKGEFGGSPRGIR